MSSKSKLMQVMGILVTLVIVLGSGCASAGNPIGQKWHLCRWQHLLDKPLTATRTALGYRYNFGQINKHFQRLGPVICGSVSMWSAEPTDQYK